MKLKLGASDPELEPCDESWSPTGFKIKEPERMVLRVPVFYGGGPGRPNTAALANFLGSATWEKEIRRSLKVDLKRSERTLEERIAYACHGLLSDRKLPFHMVKAGLNSFELRLVKARDYPKARWQELSYYHLKLKGQAHLAAQLKQHRMERPNEPIQLVTAYEPVTVGSWLGNEKFWETYREKTYWGTIHRLSIYRGTVTIRLASQANEYRTLSFDKLVTALHISDAWPRHPLQGVRMRELYIETAPKRQVRVFRKELTKEIAAVRAAEERHSKYSLGVAPSAQAG